MKELSKRFEFKEVDVKWTKRWEETGIFHARPSTSKKPYTIVIPPPNVTGILHMGHALNNTLQDIMIRYKRMTGFETLWMPGTDHAGIATQNVVEKELAREKKTRHDFSREEFLKRLWAWKEQYGDTIIRQLKRLGSSCDWERGRFTMDEGYSRAVTHVFVHLHNKGLIYRGKRIINWCPRCQTALSDEEAEHEDINGTLTHIRYPFADDPSNGIIVATTRPETMLGDTAVAVNPEDARYQHLIGQTVLLPLIKRKIKIIADAFVNPEFGTGAVKVTPAHDPNDFDMGKRHELESVNVMHPDGRINANGGEFNGLDRFTARKKIVETLKAQELLIKEEPHRHAVGHCYRCHTVVEPYLSWQWFVKMKPLAEPALKAAEEGRVNFYPERWTKVYVNWMTGIRDWCVSRQIWWGHRIPVWYIKGDTARYVVAHDAGEATKLAASKFGPGVEIEQDPDVLDTWFSSWLWPFATLNWPQENTDLKFFYPTSSLFTAPEIIFFWVARMIMAGLEFMGEVPFRDVYLHGTVRDARGRKMSKSLGNAIDPLEIIEEYGADALRFSLIINSGQDIFISKEKFEIGRNFANKIWNASRLILMNVKPENITTDLNVLYGKKDLSLISRWILFQFNQAVKQVEEAIASYRFSEAESLIYEFFWGNFCDWYLEMIKDHWPETETQQVATCVLANALKMMNPFVPFVTEEVFEHLQKEEGKTRFLSIEKWPQVTSAPDYEGAARPLNRLLELISAIRNVRAQWNLKPQAEIDCLAVVKAKETREVLTSYRPLLQRLAGVKDFTLLDELPQRKNAASILAGDIQGLIPLGDLIDVEKEKSKIADQLAELRKATDGLSSRLNSDSFTQKAPAEVVEKERARLAEAQAKAVELERILRSLD